MLRIGEDVIQLMRHDTRYRPSECLLAIGRMHKQQLFLQEDADSVALDLAERQNHAVADMRSSRGLPDARRGEAFPPDRSGL